MMADAMIQIHAQHKANKLYSTDTLPVHKPRTSLQKITSNPSLMKEIRQMKRGNSFIVGQKLRESKWFKRNEQKIVCAVVETGFIIEKHDTKNNENIFGIVVWVPGHEKSKDPYYITVYTLNGTRDKLKLFAVNLSDFWSGDAEIRINNKNDRLSEPNDEETIRLQLKHAEKRRFHNTEHFAYFCRYERPTLTRTKKITEMKWSPSSILAKFRTFSVK